MGKEKLGTDSDWERAFPEIARRVAVRRLIEIAADNLPRILRVHTSLEKGEIRLIFVASTYNYNSCYSMACDIGDMARGIFTEQSGPSPLIRVMSEDKLTSGSDRSIRLASTLWVRES